MPSSVFHFSLVLAFFTTLLSIAFSNSEGTSVEKRDLPQAHVWAFPSRILLLFGCECGKWFHGGAPACRSQLVPSCARLLPVDSWWVQEGLYKSNSLAPCYVALSPICPTPCCTQGLCGLSHPTDSPASRAMRDGLCF